MNNFRVSWLGLFLVLLSACASRPSAPLKAPATEWDGTAKTEESSRFRAVTGARGMVVSDDGEASEWGVEILRRGGNAVDAAVATALAMAVTRPHYAALGGGGFMVFCPAPAAKGPVSCRFVDFREKAPQAAHRDLFVRDGKARGDLSRDGALASGVPGVPAGLMLALEKFGTFPRAKLLTKPIQLAEQGFPVTAHLEAVAVARWSAFNDEAKRILGCQRVTGAGGDPGGEPHPCEIGTRIRQPALAKVLRELEMKGADGFYRGWVAEKIASGLAAAGGIMTTADLAAYRAELREPVRGFFQGYEVVSAPPPSAGGAVLLQMLGYTERADAQGALADGFNSARTIHALTHAMSLGFADRAKHFGDPDHVRVPLGGMLAPAYLDARWKTFKPGGAALPEGAGEPEFPSAGGGPAGQAATALDSGFHEGMNTTHFSVMDKDGNAVACTLTVNDNFGSGFVPPGTGVVMNNQMDDFAIQPGVPNLFGLVGTEANAVGPGKRPLSSMSPTIVRDREGQARIVLGAQGGPRITTSVFLALVSRLRFGMALQDVIPASRFHHQWRPKELMLERFGFAEETQARLRELGYALKDISTTGKMQAIERFPNGRVIGVSDPRTEGATVAER